MSDEYNIWALMFLRETLTEDRVTKTVERLLDDHPELSLIDPIEETLEGALVETARLSYGEDLQVWLSNCERSDPGENYKHPYGLPRLYLFEVYTHRSADVQRLLDYDPDHALGLVSPLCTVFAGLNAFLCVSASESYFRWPWHLDESWVVQNYFQYLLVNPEPPPPFEPALDVMKRRFKGYERMWYTICLDDTLAERVGMATLEEFAETIERIQGGWFIDATVSPFTSRIPQMENWRQDITRVYQERIAPVLVKRCDEEFS